MKHGMKFRKLGRTSSHRYALLRNLVSALLHHEMIKTTVPKAKEAARMAEKIITLGKRGTDPARRKAQAFLVPGHTYTPVPANQQPVPPTRAPESTFDVDADPETYNPNPSLLPKLFTTLAERYRDRPGGYTRVQKFGRRPGDYAPVALLSLVDGPRDLKFEMAARAAARETTVAARNVGGRQNLPADNSMLRPRTALAVEKALKFRSEQAKDEFARKSREYSELLIAEEEAVGHRENARESQYKFQSAATIKPKVGRRVLAGERMPGMSVAHSGLGLARGALARRADKRDRTPLFAYEKRGKRLPQAELVDVD